MTSRQKHPALAGGAAECYEPAMVEQANSGPPAADAAGALGAAAPPAPPLKKSGSDRTALVVLALLTVASGALCYVFAGLGGVRHSLNEDAQLMVMIAPRVAAAVLIGGFVQVLAPRDLVARWLGKQGGWRAFLLATVAGSATPGGPMLSFPIVYALKAAGANAPALIAYLTAWSTLGFHRILMWELPLFGAKFAIIRFIVSLPGPFIAGWTARWLITRLRRSI
ncbi:MAG: hypothetical protein O3A88_04060 [Proteobacteria bacterium]|nr:hypothetical protein [Pseudomonadota bacterium]